MWAEIIRSEKYWKIRFLEEFGEEEDEVIFEEDVVEQMNYLYFSTGATTWRDAFKMSWKHYQRFYNEPVFSTHQFNRIVLEIASDYRTDVYFHPRALQILQHTSEEYLMNLYQRCQTDHNLLKLTSKLESTEIPEEECESDDDYFPDEKREAELEIEDEVACVEFDELAKLEILDQPKSDDEIISTPFHTILTHNSRSITTKGRSDSYGEISVYEKRYGHSR
jgi:hypothetical protein